MLNYNTLNGNLKRGILNYSQNISKGLNRPDKKFVTDMLYGTLASGSCMLSEISRSLHENIKLIKTVNRLSRNLADFEAADAETVRENYLKAIISAVHSGRLVDVGQKGVDGFFYGIGTTKRTYNARFGYRVSLLGESVTNDLGLT